MYSSPSESPHNSSVAAAAKADASTSASVVSPDAAPRSPTSLSCPRGLPQDAQARFLDTGNNEVELAISQLDAEVQAKSLTIRSLENQLREARAAYEAILQSRSWRFSKPGRIAGDACRFVLRHYSRWHRAVAVIKEEGLGTFLAVLVTKVVSGFCCVTSLPSPFRIHYSLRQHQAATGNAVCLMLNGPDPAVSPIIRGMQRVHGWAWARAGITAIEVEVDGCAQGVARHGIPCLTAASQLPRDATSGGSVDVGFEYAWDAALLPPGKHTLTVRARAADGSESVAWATFFIRCLERRPDDYAVWIEKTEKPDLKTVRAACRQLQTGPLISVLMPVYNTDPVYLEAAIDSLRQQYYDNWELCIGDDASTNPDTLRVLAAQEKGNPRVRVSHLTKNGGISAATNEALRIAQGQFCVLMDSDDTVAPHALYEVAKIICDRPAVDFIYSDEDKIDHWGRRYDPFFKPDWSPDLLTSCNYLNHLTAVRTQLIRLLGGLRSEFDGSQDYDLYLRVTEATQEIVHIAKVLYHWRASPGSTAANPAARMSAHTAAQEALTASLARKGIQGSVEPGCCLGRWRVRYKIEDDPQVSIILPTGGKMDLLNHCLDGLRERTSYKNLQIVVVDNSREDKVQTLYQKRIDREFSSLYLDFRHRPFNYSILNNRAASAAAGRFLLLLNDDVYPVNTDWVEAMVEHAQRPEVGAVGVKLLYPNGTLQHAGVVMGLYDCCDHAFRFCEGDGGPTVYFDFPHIVRNCSVVTAACLMLRKEVFWEVGGFDEQELPVAFQDVDICLKIGALGYYNVYTPHAKLYHLESVTKAEKIPSPSEIATLNGRWRHLMDRDPFYNPHLSRRRADYAVRV